MNSTAVSIGGQMGITAGIIVIVLWLGIVSYEAVEAVAFWIGGSP